MRFFKILFSLLFLLVVVAGLAVVALMYTLDPNKLKPVLADAVMKQTGYQMIIQGDLGWSLYPHVGVKAQSILLHSPNQRAAFIEFKDVRVATDLVQLMQGRQRLQGVLYIGEIAVTNVHAQNANANLHWENGVLSVEHLTATLYGGLVTAVIEAKNFSTTPEWSWDMQLSNVQLKPLLTDANGPDSKLKLSGVGQIKLRATTQGKSVEQIYGNLNGTSEFMIGNGSVEGINLNYYVQAADALLNKQPIPEPTTPEQTQFSSLTGTAKIKNGIATLDDIVITAPALLAKAQGDVVLLTEALNMKVQVKPILNTHFPVEIPVLIAGDLHSPEIKLDTSEVQKFLAKQEVTEIKNKALEKIKEKVPGPAGQLLQQFLSH